MRIRVSESVTIPSLIRELDGNITLSINTALSFEEIESAIGADFLVGERDLAYSLWADDVTPRTFTPIEGSTDFYINLR
jgi:hypothetical protein